jgi:hypothetical protein
MRNDIDFDEEGEAWPAGGEPIVETESFPADDETAALLALLDAAAPRPSAEFGARLYRDLRAGRTARRRDGFWPNIWKVFGLNGGYDMKKGVAAFIMVAVLALALVAAAVPSVRAEVVETLRRIALGDSTEVWQIEPLPDELPPGEYPWQMAEGTYWVVKTDVGGYGGNVLPGEDNDVRSVATLDEAEALAGVRPLAPAELPDGYSLREVKVSPGRRPIFFQFYAGPGPDILIVQTGVGTAVGESAAVVEATVVSTVTDGELEAVTFDGRPAAWIDDRVLKWEADGLTFDVGGLGLNLETAMAIGRSLR